MAREKVADMQPSMEGGVNETSTEVMLQQNQLRRTINSRLTEFGAITKRGGMKRTAATLSSGNEIQNGFTWR